jgi:uncharacterized protein YjbI with pentapeptide repeats
MADEPDIKANVNGSIDKLIQINTLHGNATFGDGQQSLLDSYFNRIDDLHRAGDDKSSNLATARTRDICPALNGKEKARLIRYIHSLELLRPKNPFIRLSGVDLSEVNLAKAELVEINLSGANLTGANLTESVIVQANLFRSNLTDADLSGADLTKADLSSANLTRAVLRYAKLGGAKLLDANLNETDLDGAAELVGCVRAGTGDAECAPLYEGEIYLLTVIGNSMVQDNIHEGDQVVIKGSHERPAEGDIIVTKYLSPESLRVIGNRDYEDYEISGPIVKRFMRLEGNLATLQGWLEKTKIVCHIFPLGKVETVRPGTTRVWKMLPSESADFDEPLSE